MVRLFGTIDGNDKILYLEKGWLYICSESEDAVRFTMLDKLSEDGVIEQLTSLKYVELDIEDMKQMYKKKFVKAIFND